MRILIRKVRINDTIPHMMHNDIYIRHAYRNDDAIIDEYDANVPPVPYAQKYFCIESLENNNVVRFNRTVVAPHVTYYVSRDVSTWTEYDNVNGSWTINRGEKLYFKSNAGALGRIDGGVNYWYFSSTKQFNATGNAMSLLRGDNFGSKTLQYNFALVGLFINCTTLISAENLVLPATSITQQCYYSMFQNCTNLTIAPELPATTLQYMCYAYMFKDCSNLRSLRCKAQNNLPTGSVYDNTYKWLENTASGTFKKISGTNWIRTESGIPGWWSVTTY